MSYLPKSEIVGVLAPSSINARDVGKNWFDIGAIVTSAAATQQFPVYLGNGIAIVGNGGGRIFRSVDYGATWTDSGVVSGGLILSGAYLGNGKTLIGDDAGHIFRSIDFGVNWLDEGAITAGGADITNITYLGNGTVIFGTSDGHIFISIDFGVTWTDLGDITGASLFIDDTIYLENGIALAGDTTGNIYISTDFGATWSGVTGNPISTDDILTFAYAGNGLVLAAALKLAANGSIFRSIDFGVTWLDLSLNHDFNTLLYLGDGVFDAGDPLGHIFRSDNYGLTFTDLGAITGAASFVQGSYFDNGIAIMADSNGEFFRSDVSYKINESQVKIEPSFITTNADIAITQAHYTVNVDASGANRTITLANPALLQIGHEFIIKKIDNSANTVTIQTVAGNIDGVATKVLNVQWQSITVRTDGTDYFIV